MAIGINKLWVIEGADIINSTLKLRGSEWHISLDYASQYGGWQIKFENAQHLHMPMSRRLKTAEAYYYLVGILHGINEIS